jgi:hypothetical protein
MKVQTARWSKKRGGMTLMTETVAPVANPAPRPRSRKPATVSASALALHLDCSRTYIGRLEAEGVIQRQGDGFPLDQSRMACRDNCGASGSNRHALAADAEHASAKAALLRIRIEERKRELVRRTDLDAPIDDIAVSP